MTRPEALPVPPSEEEEQQVLDFLARTPDFFIRHAEVLAEMPIRHGSGGAVSLIERQVRLLREQNRSLGERLETLLVNARQNESRVRSLNRLAEGLIQADSQASVIAGLGAVLRAEFGVDAVQVGLFELPADFDELAALKLDREELSAPLRDFFRQGRVVCGRLDDALRAQLFAGHEELKSAALVPLDRANCLGLLALASTDPDRFVPDMGNLFLEMTATLCVAALRFHGAGGT